MRVEPKTLATLEGVLEGLGSARDQDGSYLLRVPRGDAYAFDLLDGRRCSIPAWEIEGPQTETQIRYRVNEAVESARSKGAA